MPPGRSLGSVPGAGEVDNTGDLNQYWAQAYGKLLAGRKSVAQRFNKGRKPHSYKEDDLVRNRIRLASSKGRIFRPTFIKVVSTEQHW